ncbi:MAG: Stp1/IreP family PP2C-type Ser/Thr phosphatase [Oscillospiraceae bacterium]|nr:Stp1/IreP family PP2C-type Ser/Thr phosphatase [Oscillospiraceae bacterium]
MSIGFKTDIGKRRELNEDCLYVSGKSSPVWAIVADGMGGHQAGEVASGMAVEDISEYVDLNFRPDMDYVEAGEVLRRAFVEANNHIYNYSVRSSKFMFMGCTSTAAMIHSGKLIIAHVGDSRVYSAKEKLVKMTKDHSYVQELVNRGIITEEEAKVHSRRNEITRAMGTEDSIKVDISITPYNGEKILICSDGLTEMVDESEIFEIMADNDNPADACRALVDRANEYGGRDNITAVIIDTKYEETEEDPK